MAKIEFTKEMALKMGRHEAMEQHCLVRYVKACREFGIPQKDFAVGHKCPMCGNLCAGSDAELKNRENAGLCNELLNISVKKEKEKEVIGEITVQVWGGTRKHPKIIGYDTQKGIVKGDFLYFDGGRYKITAHKVVSFKIISD